MVIIVEGSRSPSLSGHSAYIERETGMMLILSSSTGASAAAANLVRLAVALHARVLHHARLAQPEVRQLDLVLAVSHLVGRWGGGAGLMSWGCRLDELGLQA
jgi:hypothetical protein